MYLPVVLPICDSPTLLQILLLKKKRKNSFIEIQFTYHTIHQKCKVKSFLVYSQVCAMFHS